MSKPLIRPLPTYAQHNNGCGLASLLMLINPPENKEIEQFLNKTWELMEPLFEGISYRGLEYHWALALQYLLLKTMGYTEEDQKAEIYDFFTRRLEYSFEDQRIMNKFTQEQNRDLLLKQKKLDEAFTYLHYLEGHDYLTPLIILKNIHTMKTDIELKILAEIFNYEFAYQESEDMTGAVYFNKEELKRKPSEATIKKWAILEKWSNKPDNIILYGKYHHWLAIRGIFHKQSDDKPTEENQKEPASKKETQEIWEPRDMIIEVNDPAAVKTLRLNIGQLSETDRFYIFKKRTNETFEIFKKFLKTMEEDIEEEMRRYRQYLEKRKAATKEVPDSIAKKIKEVEANQPDNSQGKGQFLLNLLADDEIIQKDSKNQEPSRMKKPELSSDHSESREKRQKNKKN